MEVFANVGMGRGDLFIELDAKARFTRAAGRFLRRFRKGSGGNIAIMSAIVSEQSRLQGELTSSRKQGELMKKFKSGWVADSGEGLDETL